MEANTRVFLEIPDADGGGRAPLTIPYPEAAYADADGRTCPGCGRALRVVGSGRRTVDDRYWVAEASCVGCGRHVGRIEFHPPTIFGIEEDDRVLRGRCRVY